MGNKVSNMFLFNSFFEKATFLEKSEKNSFRGV